MRTREVYLGYAYRVDARLWEQLTGERCSQTTVLCHIEQAYPWADQCTAWIDPLGPVPISRKVVLSQLVQGLQGGPAFDPCDSVRWSVQGCVVVWETDGNLGRAVLCVNTPDGQAWEIYSRLRKADRQTSRPVRLNLPRPGHYVQVWPHGLGRPAQAEVCTPLSEEG